MSMPDASVAPLYELSVTRLMDVSRAIVWRAWTEHLTEWWCPKPWTTEVIANDMRPGGRSAMIMRGPNGEESAMEGVFLEVIPGEKVVFTNAFTKGWIPQAPFMIGIMTFADEDGKTRYVGSARHWDQAAMEQHAAMGFVDGWSVVAEQLEAVARGLV
ncbi:SRPBCC family protein [Sphingomonas sp. 28-63-12]|uniref:SRPBCC family protein n=1 Tax=Sphingomonas sp. 28-63-12 TaxID=1970434 RepID=UPI000BD55588|nr:MAG: ATPase [Sphingomonas sp. 28-63-12]